MSVEKRVGRGVAAAVTLLLAVPDAGAAVSTGIDAEAGLPYWELAEPGISIRLVQRLPDQTRGFFQARGFSVEDSNHIALNCVFQAIFRNTATPTSQRLIEYDLRDWVVHTAGRQRRLRTREDWKTEWTERSSPLPARLAFEWALLPTRQSYGPGDYNWGMTVFGLRPGSVFGLEVAWHQNGERRRARFENIECAPDIHPEPVAR